MRPCRRRGCIYGYIESSLIECAACRFTLSGSSSKISRRPSAKRTSQAVTSLDIVPSGEPSLAETALGAFQLGSQSGAVDLFDVVEEAFHTVVSMNQVGKSLTQVTFVGLGEFTQFPV